LSSNLFSLRLAGTRAIESENVRWFGQRATAVADTASLAQGAGENKVLGPSAGTPSYQEPSLVSFPSALASPFRHRWDSPSPSLVVPSGRISTTQGASARGFLMCRAVVWPTFPEALWHHGHQHRTIYTSMDSLRLKHALRLVLVPARGCMFFNFVGVAGPSWLPTPTLASSLGNDLALEAASTSVARRLTCGSRDGPRDVLLTGFARKRSALKRL
jgi:hypothetical protein